MRPDPINATNNVKHATELFVRARCTRDLTEISRAENNGVFRSWPFVVADYLVVRSAGSCCEHARTSRTNIFLFRERHALVDAFVRAGISIVPQTYHSRLQTGGVDLQRLPIVFSAISKDFQRFFRGSPISFRASSAVCFPEVLCYHFEESLNMVS